MCGVSFEAAFDGRHKLVRRLPDGAQWMFELATDPSETKDVSEQHPDRLLALSTGLDRWRASQRILLADAGVELDAETQRRLRELGYLGADR